MGIFPDTPEIRRLHDEYLEWQRIHRSNVRKVIQKYSPKKYRYNLGSKAMLYEDFENPRQHNCTHYHITDIFKAVMGWKVKYWFDERKVISDFIKKFEVKSKEPKNKFEHGYHVNGLFYASEDMFQALVKEVNMHS